MRILKLNSKAIEKTWIGQVPSEEHVGEIIDEDVTVYVDGIPSLIYKILPESELSGIRHICESASMQKSARVNGVPTKSCVFGAMPASPSRSTCFCRYSRATHEQKEYLSAIRRYAEFVDDIYRASFPERYNRDMTWVSDKVHSDWRWLPGPYQTLNINTNFAIPYHRDSGNVPGSLSNVLILSKRIRGGQLVCPELGITLSQRDRAWVLFNGEGLLHGVRPVIFDGPNAYRSSIVLYTLKGMGACRSRSDELIKTRELLTMRARRSKEERIEKVRQMNKRILDRKASK